MLRIEPRASYVLGERCTASHTPSLKFMLLMPSQERKFRLPEIITIINIFTKNYTSQKKGKVWTGKHI